MMGFFLNGLNTIPNSVIVLIFSFILHLCLQALESLLSRSFLMCDKNKKQKLLIKLLYTGYQRTSHTGLLYKCFGNIVGIG